MFPIAIIAGVIGAVVSSAQGASWVSDQLDSSKDTASVGSKGAAKSQTDAKASPFEAALAAQVTGQSVPAGTAVAPATSSVSSSQLATQYDTLARTNAGIAAYSQIGEHHGSHGTQSSAASDDKPVTGS